MHPQGIFPFPEQMTPKSVFATSTPEGKIVVRNCGNKKCINPDHLALTTHNEKGARLKEYNAHPIDFDIDPMTGCFNCTSHPQAENGYHVIRINYKNRYLHRFVFEQMKEEIPKGKIVRHTCDNRSCINPEHLVKGTHKDNMRDMVERGRSAKGSKSHLAKLTEDDVHEIKRRLAAGESNSHLGRLYGVRVTTINNIKLGKTWKHVD